MQERYRDRGLQVVLLTREPAERIRSIPQLAEGPVTIIPDADPIFEKYAVSAVPRTVVHQSDGEIIADFEGYSPRLMEALAEQLQALPPRQASARQPALP